MDINTNNTNREFKESELIKQLQDLPLENVPEDLTRNIMRSISSRQPRQGLLARILQAINRPFVISVNPLYAMVLIVVVCGSFMLGRISTENIVHSPVMMADSDGYSLPAPDNPKAAHLLGRGLLAAEKRQEALKMLHNAASRDPHNPEYAYWEGIGYWANENYELERNSYLRGLAAAPDSVPLLINLGHNYLSNGNFEQALNTYQAALERSPSEEIALYNIGLIYRRQKMVNEEIHAWKAYLKNYRTGNLAFRAVKRLNSYGVFSYRSYLIGARNIILSPEILLDPSVSYQEKKNELSPVISILEANTDINLEVVIFSENNRLTAKKKAFAIKEILAENSSETLSNRIALSWLDSPEPATVNNEKQFSLSDSLLIFSTTSHQPNKEVSI